MPDSRPHCWFGTSCRTAGHSPSHALRLSHLFPPTRFPPPRLQPAPEEGHRTGGFVPGYSAPAFDPSAITFRGREGEVYVLASHWKGDGNVVPGKLTLKRDARAGPGVYGVVASYVWKGIDVVLSGGGVGNALFEDPETMQWVSVEADGALPEGSRPVRGGRDDEGRQKWHVAGWVDGVRMPGWSGEGQAVARIGAKGREWIVGPEAGWEVLCWK